MRIESRSAAAEPGAFDRCFGAVPARLRRDPYRVALLPAQLTTRMLNFPLPRPADFCVAFTAAGDVTGRIGVNLSPLHEGVAYAGFFEVDTVRDDASAVAAGLLEHVAGWARARGATRLVGPIDLSTWFSYRFVVERATTQGEQRFHSWEPVNPPEYPEYFVAAGWSEIALYHSQGFRAASAEGFLPGYDSLRRAHDDAHALGFRLRPLDRSDLARRDLPLLHEMSHAVFGSAFLFEPLPYRLFAEVYAAAMQRYDYAPSFIAEAPDGAPGGFLFAFFDDDHLVIKTVAVLPAYQRMRLSSALLFPAAEMARARGVRHGVSALVHDGGKIEHHERRSETETGGALWRHDYALFGRDL